MVKEITVSELKSAIEQNEDIQIIDVRETSEYEAAEIGGQLIPLGSLPDHVNEISKDRKVIIHCRSGKRSENAIRFLESNFGFSNLYNLKGGILAWKAEIDPSLNVS
ncbi:MAG: rhodanese-like domain-containing protein [Cytophagales bacterium]|nr:MAG: rhodanese-like domain-containing protein [Cytophagales bacterium]